MTKSKRIKLLEEYIRYLEKAAINYGKIAHIHGVKLDEETLAKGKKLREKLEWINDEHLQSS